MCHPPAGAVDCLTRRDEVCLYPPAVHSAPNVMPERVAFLGLGAIGAPMARHLASSPAIATALWNRTVSKAEALARAVSPAAGAEPPRVASSPADAARGASAVLLCLPSSREVESLLDGPQGLL